MIKIGHHQFLYIFKFKVGYGERKFKITDKGKTLTGNEKIWILFVATMKDKKLSEKPTSVVYLIQLNSIFRNHFNICLSKRRQSRNSSTTRNTKNCKSRRSKTQSRSLPRTVCHPWQMSSQNLKGSQLRQERQSSGT